MGHDWWMTDSNTPGPDILTAASGLNPDTVELRRAIHEDPELGLDLPNTQAKILESLTGLGLDITTGDATTSVVADLDSGKPGPTVLLRGDMDALPMQEDNDLTFASKHENRMHACGHDGHVAMLASAAKLLADHKDELTGKVRFMFQPGEEGFAGAKVMIEEGVLKGVDRAFAIHLTTNAPAGQILSKPGPILASADRFEITVHGSGGHASMPHRAVDPIPAAAATITALHTMVGRTIDANQPGVLTVAHMHSGTTNNVIPPHAFMEGTIRALSERTRAELHEGLQRVATNTAMAHNCSCTAEVIPGYPVTVNNDEQADLAAATALNVLGEEHYRAQPTPIMGAEDFSYVLNEVPGAMVSLGACPAGTDYRKAAPNHSNFMQINEDALDHGVAMYAAMALTR